MRTARELPVCRDCGEHHATAGEAIECDRRHGKHTMPVYIQPFDFRKLAARHLQTMTLDVESGSLTLKFADHTEIWLRIPRPDNPPRGALRTFAGDIFVGPRDQEAAYG